MAIVSPEQPTGETSVQFCLATPEQLVESYALREQVLEDAEHECIDGVRQPADSYDTEEHPETIHAVGLKLDKVIATGRITEDRVSPGDLQVSYFGISPEMQRQKVGTRLLEFIEKEATRRHAWARSIFLGSNHSTVPFYEQAGYDVWQRKPYKGVILMQKKIIRQD